MPLFRALPPAALRGLVYRLRPREVTAKGALLVEQGHPADGLYVVHRGDCVSSVAPPKEVSTPHTQLSSSTRRSGVLNYIFALWSLFKVVLNVAKWYT